MSHLDHLNFRSVEHIIEKVFDMSWLKAFVMSILAVWATLFKNQTEIMAIIPLLIIVDALTGFMAAWIKKDISSSEFHKTLLKAFIYFIFLIVARSVDMFMPGEICTYVTDFFIVSTEAISILENISKMGFPVPTSMVHRLREYQDKIAKK